MIKATFFVIVTLIAVAYSIDPSAIKPWGEVANHVGVIVAQEVKVTGETANKAIHDAALRQ